LICFSGISYCIGAENNKPATKETTTDISINSDNLNFFLNENKAIFEGKVEVFHDDMKLESDKLIVLFNNKKDKNLSFPSPTLETKENFTTKQEKISVSNIEAIGNVVLTTQNEVVRGDKGFYDVKNETITLFGNVELTQNNNYLKGDKLIYNRITKERLLTSNKNYSKRVFGKFTPEEKND